MNYLDNINSPSDLRKLKLEELNSLCKEIRQFMINVISKTGGHIASNLGVVELTVALHYVFNTPEDKIIWDVGHQCYVHKILTGRKERMISLRQHNGLSGFPKRCESNYDVFDTGHSSTSISAALGMARARDLKNEKNEIIAVIGDGALTGGMAFEALNDAGRSNAKLIVILNDNQMSISPNVGGMSIYLSKVRTSKSYLSTKKDIENILHKVPFGGEKIKSFLKKTKDGFKKMVVPGMFFEELGLTYMGPINGHSIEKLSEAFEIAKTVDGPILIHVITKKGYGYKYTEERPDDYHGVSPFDINTGKSLKTSNVPSYSEMFGDCLCDISKQNKKVVAITAAMTDGTGLNKFSKMFPERIFDVGIAEQHAVTMAAGMASYGLTPVVTLYSSFLQRAYDQVVHDVATQNLHVVFAIDRAGLVGNDGETHQGVFDGGFLSQIPNMTIMSPADYREMRSMLYYAINEHNGPIAMRYPRDSSYENLNNTEIKIQLGKGVVIDEGKDVTIIASGRMVTTALKIRDILKNSNILAEVINLRFIKPLDDNLIIQSVSKTKKAVIIDEAPLHGSIAINIKDMLLKDTKVLTKTLPDEFIRQGSIIELLKENKLDPQSIALDIVEFYNNL